MKFITLLLILAAIAFGVKYAYDQGLLNSVNNTVQRTGDFATDKAVKSTNFTGSGESY